ncbi:MAG: AIM24 family protein [Solirubrobacteraceae bacterium]
MDIPQQITSQVHDETWAGVTYHIRGELVPELQVELTDAKVFFEHHTLLWRQTDVKIEIRKMSGAIKRKIAGGEFFVTRAQGPGRVPVLRDHAGQKFPQHHAHREGVDVREHQFVAATDNVDFSFERVKGIRNMLFGATGFFMDKFRAKHGDGIVWIHGQGNVFVVDLEHGEKIDVEPGGWLYKEMHVKMEPHTTGLRTGFFAGGGKFTWQRFTGPGRVAIQTMYIAPVEGDTSNE